MSRPGFGDSETWPAHVSPRDPRWTDSDPEQKPALPALVRELNIDAARAHDALTSNDSEQCRVILLGIMEILLAEFGIEVPE